MGVVSRATSRAIYEDAIAVCGEERHPCHGFAHLQEGVPPGRWQFPIPFMGHSADLGLVFLGFNPSYDVNEDSPRWGDSFEDFDRHYRSFFDTRKRPWPQLYERYQHLGAIAAGPQFRLGREALVLEVVRYRSAKPHPCYDAGVLAHELPTTYRLLAEVAPRVIFCSGGDALYYLRELLPGLRAVLAKDFRITEVEGRIYRFQSPFGSELAVLGARHLTGAWRMSSTDRQRLGGRLGEALSAPRTPKV